MYPKYPCFQSFRLCLNQTAGREIAANFFGIEMPVSVQRTPGAFLSIVLISAIYYHNTLVIPTLHQAPRLSMYI